MSKSFLRSVGAAGLWTFWAFAVFDVWRYRGLFDWLGVDFALYSVGAQLILSGHAISVYDLASVARELVPYAVFYGEYADPLKAGPLPYPALTFLLYAPFLPFRPPVGFLLWALVNFSLAVYVVRDLTNRLPERSWSCTALSLTYYPLVYGLFVGQPVVVLLFAFFQAYCCWETGRDFRAGLWCGLLLMKIQYPFVLVLVLLYKGRWRSLLGFAVTGAVFALTSLASFGVRGIVAHLATIESMSRFHSSHTIIYPEFMINWRGLLLNVLPASVPESVCISLTMLLSALTAATLLVIWRDRWEPKRPEFARRMLATLLVTLLVSFHSHSHGATLLLVPGIAYLAHRTGPRLLTPLLHTGLFAPTIIFASTFDSAFVAFLFIALMVGALAVILTSELAPGHANPCVEALVGEGL